MSNATKFTLVAHLCGELCVSLCFVVVAKRGFVSNEHYKTLYINKLASGVQLNNRGWLGTRNDPRERVSEWWE